MGITFLNALSKSFGSSEASTSRAISTKRLCRSASESFGKRFVLGFSAMPHNVASSKGNSSWSGSASRRYPRHLRGRLGRLRSPLARSCLIGKPLADNAFQSEIGALLIVNAELNAVGIAEIKLRKIPLQMGF